MDDKHDFTCGRAIKGNVSHRTKVMVWPQIADPGQRAIDNVAAIDFFGVQQKGLDARKGFHRVGHARRAQRLSIRMFEERFTCQCRVTRLLHVQTADVVAPDHKACGTAHARHFGHGSNGQAVVCGLAWLTWLTWHYRVVHVRLQRTQLAQPVQN